MSNDVDPPIVTVSVQFPDLSQAEFAELRARLIGQHEGRVVVAHHAHRWYAASTDPETVAAAVHGLDAALSSRALSFDDEETLEDLAQEYEDWLSESAEMDDDQPGPLLSFSVHLPALERDEFAAILTTLRVDHPRRIVLGEQRGQSHHELSERSRVRDRFSGLRAALSGAQLDAPEALALEAMLNDYAHWLSNEHAVLDTPE